MERHVYCTFDEYDYESIEDYTKQDITKSKKEILKEVKQFFIDNPTDAVDILCSLIKIDTIEYVIDASEMEDD